MMISVHLPKTAGESFAATLKAGYEERLLLDYDDRPLWRPGAHRNIDALLKLVKLCFNKDITRYACIHGHFLPIKYLGLRFRVDLAFVTWMRNPVERLASHYYYWKRMYIPGFAPDLHTRMREEEWSLERFCEAGRVRNVYSKFLWGMRLERFDFIGIVEDFERSRELFYRMWPIRRICRPLENVNPEVKSGCYTLPRSTREYIESMNEADLALYDKALSINRELLAKYELRK